MLPAHILADMVDLDALQAELNALAGVAPSIDWDTLAETTRVLIAQASLNGGVVSYSVNGRSVSRNVEELTKILKLAESRGTSRGGGIIAVLGEFGQ